MTFQEFKQRVRRLSKLIHFAWSEGRVATMDYLERRKRELIEAYPEYAD